MKPLQAGGFPNALSAWRAGSWASAFLFLAAYAEATVTYEKKSEPAGIITPQTVNMEVNASVTTPTAPATSGNRVFSHWTLNGQRQAGSDDIAQNRF